MERFVAEELRTLVAQQRRTLPNTEPVAGLFKRFVDAFGGIKLAESGANSALSYYVVTIPGTCRAYDLPAFQIAMANSGFKLAPHPGQVALTEAMQYNIWPTDSNVNVYFTLPKGALSI